MNDMNEVNIKLQSYFHSILRLTISINGANGGCTHRRFGCAHVCLCVHQKCTPNFYYIRFVFDVNISSIWLELAAEAAHRKCKQQQKMRLCADCGRGATGEHKSCLMFSLFFLHSPYSTFSLSLCLSRAHFVSLFLTEICKFNLNEKQKSVAKRSGQIVWYARGAIFCRWTHNKQKMWANASETMQYCFRLVRQQHDSTRATSFCIVCSVQR